MILKKYLCEIISNCEIILKNHYNNKISYYKIIVLLAYIAIVFNFSYKFNNLKVNRVNFSFYNSNSIFYNNDTLFKDVNLIISDINISISSIKNTKEKYIFEKLIENSEKTKPSYKLNLYNQKVNITLLHNIIYDNIDNVIYNINDCVNNKLISNLPHISIPNHFKQSTKYFDIINYKIKSGDTLSKILSISGLNTKSSHLVSQAVNKVFTLKRLKIDQTLEIFLPNKEIIKKDSKVLFRAFSHLFKQKLKDKSFSNLKINYSKNTEKTLASNISNILYTEGFSIEFIALIKTDKNLIAVIKSDKNKYIAKIITIDDNISSKITNNYPNTNTHNNNQENIIEFNYYNNKLTELSLINNENNQKNKKEQKLLNINNNTNIDNSINSNNTTNSLLDNGFYNKNTNNFIKKTDNNNQLIQTNLQTNLIKNNEKGNTVLIKGIVNPGKSLFKSFLTHNIPSTVVSQLRYAFNNDDIYKIKEQQEFIIVYNKKSENNLNSHLLHNKPELLYFSLKKAKNAREIEVYRYISQYGDRYYLMKNDNKFFSKEIDWIKPVSIGSFNSNYGVRYHPIHKRYKMHYGVDYGAPYGSKIVAAGDGFIVEQGKNGGFGKTIKIRHNRRYLSLYAHMSNFAPGIHIGRFVKKGQLIGYVGSSGSATGSHLHFEIHENGKRINPAPIIGNINSIDRKQMIAFKEQQSKINKVIENAVRKY
ncbi:M23 family metallopeptidase [Lyticum sinuosum]|uniref:M23 family metallopeptidase n=1 Tax=Lyticum sinuosum TaxID=1332059 RepID=A0AAE4VL03_9RICK|nr:M23 family metallopeptidase [Lyticum sinuosum]MDZ5761570.1 M23 family metallopeptidase [Lyticum sinuosum]